jgi:hypothetical protein
MREQRWLIRTSLELGAIRKLPQGPLLEEEKSRPVRFVGRSRRLRNATSWLCRAKRFVALSKTITRSFSAATGHGSFLRSLWPGGLGQCWKPSDKLRPAPLLNQPSRKISRLFQADARHFRLRHRVNAVVCFYNIRNQFLEPDSFRAVLASSFRNLTQVRHYIDRF